MCLKNIEICTKCYYYQGRSLTMGQEGPGPPLFGSDYGKSKVGPPLFQIKKAQNDFGSLGPSSFKSVTTPLIITLLLSTLLGKNS